MLAEELRENILEGDLTELLRHSGDEDFPAEVARLLQSFTNEEAINVFVALPDDLKVKTFSFFDHVIQLGIMEELPGPQRSNILNNLESNDRVSFFDSLDGVEVTEYLALVGAMARLLRHEEVRAKLMQAKTPEEFLAVLGEDPEAV